MPDFSLCTNKTCPLAVKCKRSQKNTDPSPYRQVYSLFNPNYENPIGLGASNFCDFFMEIDNNKEQPLQSPQSAGIKKNN